MRKQKILLHVTLGIVTVAVALACWSFLIEPNRLVVHRNTISLPNWPTGLNNLRVAAIGDIHAGSPFIDIPKLRQIAASTLAEKPDLIAILGDFMAERDYRWKHDIAPETIAVNLKDLHAPLGVYAVLGNHDWGYDGPRVRQALESVGIMVLENEAVLTSRNGQSLYVVGLADLWTRPQQIESTLAKVPAGQPLIVLTHNPDVFPLIPPAVNLTFAAHTHGGQVNFPFVGALMVPSAYGQSYAAGHVTEGGRNLFVTTGIGTSILPVRFRVPPEIAILTLNSN